MKQQPSMPPRTYWVSFFVCVCSRTLMLTRLASIKCHILWSNFNGIVATMATPMNYIVVFLCHMLRVCAAYDIVIIILLCGCCSLIHILDFYFWFFLFHYHRSFFFSLTHSCARLFCFHFFLVHHDGANALRTSFQWQVTSFFAVGLSHFQTKDQKSADTHRVKWYNENERREARAAAAAKKEFAPNETKRNRTLNAGWKRVYCLN